jgi:iron complex outermembrane receptor protein
MVRDVGRIFEPPGHRLRGPRRHGFLGERPLPFSESLARVVRARRGGERPPTAFVELGGRARNLTDARWRDGVFNYVSAFDPSMAVSRVPAPHYSAGRPLTVLTTLSLVL